MQNLVWQQSHTAVLELDMDTETGSCYPRLFKLLSRSSIYKPATIKADKVIIR